MLHLVHAKHSTREKHTAPCIASITMIARSIRSKNLRFRSMPMRGTRETQVFYYIGNIA